MSSPYDLALKMSQLNHRVPRIGVGDLVLLHSFGSSGKLWCYCTNCNAMGGINARGELIGKATISACAGLRNGAKHKPKALTPE